jgi:tRNA(Glu) U13 pseudouridine synthase TruD
MRSRLTLLVVVHNLSNDDKKSNDDRNASDGSSKSCTTAAAGNHAQAEAPPSIYSTEENRIAVVLKFALASSTYATMALRELSHSGIVQYTPEFRRPEEVKSKE